MKNVILLIVFTTLFGCSKSIPLVNEHSVINTQIHITDAVLGKSIKLNAIERSHWKKLTNEDQKIVSSKLKKLKSGLNYASCIHIFHLKVDEEEEPYFLTIDSCGYVWGKSNVYKGVSPFFWEKLKEKYIE